MTPLARRLRGWIFRALAQEGRLPGLASLAPRLEADVAAVRAAAAELDAAHLLVLDQQGEVEWALPFSAVPTPNRVSSGTRTWWTPCAWDALAVAPLLGIETVYETPCPDCGTSLRVAVTAHDATVLMPAPPHVTLGRSAVGRSPAVVHFGRPATDWWVDIRET
jgi:hypothetical protein